MRLKSKTIQRLFNIKYLYLLSILLFFLVLPIIAVAGDPHNEAPKIVTGVPHFIKQIIDNTMKETHFAVPGDFDLDGNTDVVATNYVNDTVAWYKNNGSNGFTKHVIDSNLDGAYPVHIADLNRDGVLDVLATGYLADAIVWYENNGTGGFTRHIIDANSNGAHSVYATDLDGDNDTDVVTSSQDANTIAWYENDGSSNFIYHLIDNNAIGAKYAFAADLDGDNDVDIARASFFDKTIAWYENDGQQNFHEITIDTQANGAYYVLGTDLDGDGNTDLVSASQNDNTIAWYKNNGYGGFTKRVIDNFATGARSVFSEDVDNDGDTDVLSASVNDDTIAWYRNDGRGTFNKQPIDIAAGGAYGVSTGNLNGDGQIDVIAASRDDNAIILYHQIRVHKASLVRGSNLVIRSDLLQATDVDNTPADLIFTVSDIPNFGQLQLNSVSLAHNGTFTQADINNNSVSYVHNGGDTKSDSFNFTLIDGGQDGVRPGKGNFTLNIQLYPLTIVRSDDFYTSSLNQSLWTFVNPLRDAVLTMTGTQASIFVPAGTSHDVWNSNLAPRIMQNASNMDFDVEAKFESVMNSQYQVQGLIVQQDANNFLRFDFVRDALNTRIFAASFKGGSPSVRSDLKIPHGSPLYVRVNRQGDLWTQSYSYDGEVFMKAAIFNHSITVGSIGVYAANHGIPGISSPAFTGVIDYFFNTASPIIMEDGGNFQEPVISKQPLDMKINVGMTVTFSVEATGTTPLTYQWQKNGIDIPGAINPSYTTPPTTILDNGSLYRVNVTNPIGSVMSNSASLTISIITAPSILTQPSNQTVTAGQNATFGVVATGSSPLSYQWQKNGMNIPGATSSSYTTPATNMSDNSSTYCVNITNPGGSVLSYQAKLTIRPSFILLSDDFNTGSLNPSLWNVVNPRGDATITIISNSTQDALLSIAVPGGQEHDVWNGNNAPRVMQSVSNTNFEIELKFQSQLTSGYQMQGVIVQQDSNKYLRFDTTRFPTTTNIFAASFSGGLPTSRYNVAINSGNPIYLRVNRTGDQWKQSYSYDGNNWIAAANFSYPLIVSSVGPFAGNALGSSSPAFTGLVDYFFDTSSPIAPEDGNKHHIPVVSTQPLNQSVTSGENATFSVVAIGTSPLSYQWQKNGTDIPGATNALYTTPLTSMPDNGSTYRVNITNLEGSVMSNSATLTILSPNAPTIITQPSNQTVDAGQNAIFSVVATGTSPLSYQWQKNGTDIPGATNASYMTPATINSDNGSTYRVNVTNPAGSVMSNSATLTILSPTVPTIISQPSNQTVDAGQNAIFSVVATGTSPLSYQWQKNGTDIPGATNASYTTPATTSSDNGSTYRVNVTNPAGSVISNSATLTISSIKAPTITTQPLNQTVNVGQTATFNGVATGTALSYQWQKNGTDIPGATNASYTTPATTNSDNGSTYRVNVTNPAGSVISNSATLTVKTPINLIKNGGFDSGKNDWTFYTIGSGNFNIVSPGYEGNNVSMLAFGGGGTNIQLYQTEVTLQPNTAYRLSFAAYSTTGHDVTVRLSKHVSPYTSYMSDYTVDLGTNWQVFSKEFITTGLSSTVNDGRFWFWLSPFVAAEDNYYIDDVRLEKTNVSDLPPIPETKLINITIWYGDYQKFRQIGLVQRYVNIIGNVNGPFGVKSLTYSLNGGTNQSLSMGRDGVRLQYPGDFNIEIDYANLVCGNNTIAITARDTLNNIKNKMVEVDYACGNTWPLPYFINWSEVSNIQDVAQVIDGEWNVSGNKLNQNKIGYDRLVGIGDMTWTDYEVEVPITINKPLDSSVPYGPNFGVILRWQEHVAWGARQPREGWYPLGALAVYIWAPERNDYRLRLVGNGMQVIADTGMRLDVGKTYIFKAKVQTIGSRSLYSLKVWQQNTTEPDLYTISGYGVSGGLSSGSALLGAYYANVSFGNVVIKTGNLPLTLSNVYVEPYTNSATISWSTSKQASSNVSYGLSTAYENGSVVDGTMVWSHTILLEGLKPGTNYHYKIKSTDILGDSSSTQDMNFTTMPVVNNTSIASDDFNSPTLNTSLWTVVNPKGDATITIIGNGTSDALLSIAIPPGQEHDVWQGNNAPRVMQSVSNTNFEVDLKFQSQPTSAYQIQGVIIQQDSKNYLRFDFVKSPTTTNIFAASFAAGSPTKRYEVPITSGNPMYLRVNRTGNQWKQFYSSDGTNWIVAANFSYPLIVSSVGPFAGNALGSSSPAFTGLVDYFFNTISPVVPEDGY